MMNCFNICIIDFICSPGFATSWLEGKIIFIAGDITATKIKVMDSNNIEIFVA